MLVKLQEAQKVGTVAADNSGRLVADVKYVYRDLMINPDHVVSINEDVEYSRNSGSTYSRIETTRGVFTVVGSPSDIQTKLGGATSATRQKVLRD